MTLAFLSSSSGWGGLERNLLRHARWLSSNRHRSVVLAVEGTPLWNAAADLDRVAIVRHHRYAHGSAARQMARQLKAIGALLLWTRDPRDLGIGGRAAERSGIPFLFHQGMQLAGPKLMPWHVRRYQRIGCWVAPLGWLKTQVEAWTPVPGERIETIPLGLDDSWFEPPAQRMAARSDCGLPRDKRLVGCFGRLDALKGQDVLIRSLQHLPEIWEAVLVGDNTVNDNRNMRQELEQVARQTGVAHRVHFLPAMDPLRPAFDAVDVLAMCSTSETIGMVTLEAMAAGCAVVGTRSGGTPELFLRGRVDGRALWAPGDERELARCIEAGPFRADREAVANEFGQSQVIAQWESLLERLLSPQEKP